LTVDLAAVTNGLFVPHVGHRHHRFRCAHNERPLFSRHSGIGIYAVAAISMLRAHAAQIQWVRCGLRAAVRCNWLGCPLSGPNRPTNFNVDLKWGGSRHSSLNAKFACRVSCQRRDQCLVALANSIFSWETCMLGAV